MMPRPQFTLRGLLVAVLVVAAFFGGVRFERQRRKQHDVDHDNDYSGPLSAAWVDVGLRTQ